VRDRAHASREEIQTLVSETLRADEFDTGLDRIAAELRDLGSRGPAELLLATAVLTQLPAAAYLPPQRLALREIGEGDARVAQDALRFGEVLMARRFGRDFRDNLQLEYAVGKSIYLTAWKRLHPGEVPPPLASLQELAREARRSADTGVSVRYRRFLSSPREECDPHDWEEAFAAERARR
jgi:hypothetical protein